MKKLLFIPFFLFTLFSCSQNGGLPSVYACLEHRAGSTLDVEVSVCGESGMALNGVNVILTDPVGSSSRLNYDGDSSTYTGSLYDALSGTFSVSVVSPATVEPIEMAVPFTALSQSPIISEITDSAGNQALSGDAVSAALSINAEWSSVENSTNYLVTVIQAGSLMFSATVNNPNILIPASALEPGYASISVEAQAISGDPLLRSATYYSISAITGPSLSFLVES